jgi:mycothiol system anti-sigma-R factor
VLERLYEFIDQELDEAYWAKLRHHLDECGPCLSRVDLERLVKTLVARSCCEQAPVELRQRVLFSIRQVQMTSGEGSRFGEGSQFGEPPVFGERPPVQFGGAAEGGIF